MSGIHPSGQARTWTRELVRRWYQGVVRCRAAVLLLIAIDDVRLTARDYERLIDMRVSQLREGEWC